MTNPVPKMEHPALSQGAKRTYWRVEGSLLEIGALRPVGFFTWNARSFSERWARRAGMAGMALTRPVAYAASRTFATRFLHSLLRGVSRDRLDLLGEEYFHYVLDRKSTRLNSSHEWISYAVFCLKKKKTTSETETAADSE